MIIMFILGVVFLIVGIYLSKKGISANAEAQKITLQRQNEQNVIDTQLQTAQNELNALNSRRDNLLNQLSIEQNKLNDFYEKEYFKINSQLQEQKNNISAAAAYHFEKIEANYAKQEEIYHNKVSALKQNIEDVNKELQKLKNTLNAGIEAQLREQELQDKLSFYTLQLDDRDRREISAIRQVEDIMLDPRPLKMLIWSTYYSKKANDLAARVLGPKTITGIYRITNNRSKQSYIGQAKDMRERWREHMKCGLGIDTPAGNKLYKAMLEDGIENFTFELLEACPAAELDEKERFFIELYDTYNYGYNSNKGNKK